MEKYPKIKTVYLRDPQTKYKTLLEGQYAEPVFEYLAYNEWLYTEKIDGTSVRCLWQPGTEFPLVFKGRTDKAQFPTFLYEKLQQMFSVSLLDKLYPDTSMCLYGEGFGMRIQRGGGNYIPDGVSFILFDVKINNYWLKREDVEDIAAHLGIAVVPIVGKGTLSRGVAFVRIGFQSRVAQNTRDAEGLVMRPAVELLTRAGHRIICKIKHKDFSA